MKKNRQSTTSEFIEKARKVHGDKFDYSKVEYKGSHTIICIICSEHGEFYQQPTNHLSGNGCKKCAYQYSHGKYRLTSFEKFLSQAKEIHGEKYNYSKEIIIQIKETEAYKEFTLINIDENKVPNKIKVVPTIVDSEIKNLLEGKKAFEYLYNKKYFNIPTNNIHLWKDKVLPIPDIIEDNLAKNDHDNIFESQKISDNNEIKPDIVEPVKKRINISKNSIFRLRGIKK